MYHFAYTYKYIIHKYKYIIEKNIYMYTILYLVYTFKHFIFTQTPEQMIFCNESIHMNFNAPFHSIKMT